MFVVEVLMSAFNAKGGVIEQTRNTKYFDNIDEAMGSYNYHYSLVSDLARTNYDWDVFVISIFGGSELLKMQTIRCEKEN